MTVRRRPSFPSWHVVAPAGIALVTFLVFSGALRNAFVEWDDDVLFTTNEHYRGLGPAQLRWMFTSFITAHYMPVTWLTHGLDYVLWGMNPAGYHLTNLVLHAANAALFFLLAVQLLRAAPSFAARHAHVAAAASALVFALHPLRVEAVAWVTARRDVLSAFFFLLALLAYLHALEAGGRRRTVRHGLALIAYVLGIFSKSIVMTLPALLVLLDVYPLRRLGADPRTWTSPAARAVWREKIPYALLGLGAAMLAYHAVRVNALFSSPDLVGWAVRPSLVGYSLAFYLSKTMLPTALAPLYALPGTLDPLAPRFVASAIAVAMVTVVLVSLRRRWPAGLAAWIAYAILVAPVSGALHAGFQLAYDRYSYLACLPFALVIGSGVGWFAHAHEQDRLRPPLAAAGAGAFAVWLAGLSFLTWEQVATWRDTDALWESAVAAQPDCALCRFNLATRAFNAGRHDVAGQEFAALLRMRPDPRVHLHAMLGLAHMGLGDASRAVAYHRTLLARNPNDPVGHTNVGAALSLLGRHREALVAFQEAFRLAPEDAVVRSNLGAALAEAGETEPALRHLDRAIELNPGLAPARFARGVILAGRARADDARRDYEALQRINPTLASILAGALVTGW